VLGDYDDHRPDLIQSNKKIGLLDPSRACAMAQTGKKVKSRR